MCFLNRPLQILYFRDQVWEMEWNISRMTLATTRGDGVPTFLLPPRHNHPFNLKAYMDDYGGINRCVFTVNSISDPINIEEPPQLEALQPQTPQPQPPKTPNKRAPSKKAPELAHQHATVTWKKTNLHSL
ncbi:hypothetical protein RHSIM_Rhsim12G0186200 [Rhododendron simsii]|uniref:Uncharacterized protein n=1 Tax=Rhododendron simsii TaxID=118357 RepID=A0A834L9N6_RHOSS|nr:hypothetical protein RHSIM_Rhsim12G0186200 [Rhododendron simsii]